MLKGDTEQVRNDLNAKRKHEERALQYLGHRKRCSVHQSADGLLCAGYTGVVSSDFRLLTELRQWRAVKYNRIRGRSMRSQRLDETEICIM